MPDYTTGGFILLYAGLALAALAPRITAMRWYALPPFSLGFRARLSKPARVVECVTLEL
jgi:hypothetical protein